MYQPLSFANYADSLEVQSVPMPRPAIKQYWPQYWPVGYSTSGWSPAGLRAADHNPFSP